LRARFSRKRSAGLRRTRGNRQSYHSTIPDHVEARVASRMANAARKIVDMTGVIDGSAF
jgi:hypothetical protein